MANDVNGFQDVNGDWRLWMVHLDNEDKVPKKSCSPAGTSTPRGWPRVSPRTTWSPTSPPCTREPLTGGNKYTMASKERQKIHNGI